MLSMWPIMLHGDVRLDKRMSGLFVVRHVDPFKINFDKRRSYCSLPFVNMKPYHFCAQKKHDMELSVGTPYSCIPNLNHGGYI